MKKIFFMALAFILTFAPMCAFEGELRGYSPILLKKGAFIKVVNQRMISTAIADEGDEVSFIVPTDIWCGEAKIFPQETMFYGFVEELNEPVQGTNGALKLKINKVVLPDNSEYPIDAYVTHKGEITIGGELTPPLEYTKMPHHIRYPNVYKGVLQYVQGNKRYFGHHLVIKAGAELVLMLNEDYNAVISEF